MVKRTVLVFAALMALAGIVAAGSSQSRPAGKVWATTGAPSSGTGSNGDFAFDAATRTIYQKSSNAWSAGTALGAQVKFVSVTLLVTDLTKAVTISPAMADANYEVVPVLDGSSLAWPLSWVTSKTASGFTLNLLSGLAGTRKFMLVPSG